jgi:hypothetical protein
MKIWRSYNMKESKLYQIKSLLESVSDTVKETEIFKKIKQHVDIQMPKPNENKTLPEKFVEFIREQGIYEIEHWVFMYANIDNTILAITGTDDDPYYLVLELGINAELEDIYCMDNSFRICRHTGRPFTEGYMLNINEDDCCIEYFDTMLNKKYGEKNWKKMSNQEEYEGNGHRLISVKVNGRWNPVDWCLINYADSDDEEDDVFIGAIDGDPMLNDIRALGL